MRWDISSCPNEELQAGEDSKIIVSRSYPNKIELGWQCIYHIYAPDIEQRILIEFEDILLSPICEEQNITVIDGETQRELGPLCDDRPPPDFVSDSDEVIIKAFVSETSSSDMPTRGYMFKYRWVDKDYAQSLEHLINEFTNAAYEDQAEGNHFGSWNRRGGRMPITRAPLPNSGFDNFGPRKMTPPDFDGQSFSTSGPKRPQINNQPSLNVPVYRSDGGMIDKNGKLNLYPPGSPLGPPVPTRRTQTRSPSIPITTEVAQTSCTQGPLQIL
ncbi:Oidioi.mRNA.OKI2018_I69.chr2.g4149.t1.cds [Oikopleura dioica]|uniref:Oidioi.mRNA.OKI2018_I69.chr2.g4149.t1.cds n=1 Tax=Oikopleura dioica TaxID=34765 RepID=A0ABN7SW76_OIKDI|nr:Oidioi.mRNA.OKI2018_I69.chr2.g4149.t1.cds [Oikopleura dioica]